MHQTGALSGARGSDSVPAESHTVSMGAWVRGPSGRPASAPPPACCSSFKQKLWLTGAVSPSPLPGRQRGGRDFDETCRTVSRCTGVPRMPRVRSAVSCPSNRMSLPRPHSQCSGRPSSMPHRPPRGAFSVSRSQPASFPSPATGSSFPIETGLRFPSRSLQLKEPMVIVAFSLVLLTVLCANTGRSLEGTHRPGTGLQSGNWRTARSRATAGPRHPDRSPATLAPCPGAADPGISRSLDATGKSSLQVLREQTSSPRTVTESYVKSSPVSCEFRSSLSENGTFT